MAREKERMEAERAYKSSVRPKFMRFQVAYARAYKTPYIIRRSVVIYLRSLLGDFEGGPRRAIRNSYLRGDFLINRPI
jgi:hypothetical protein